MAARMIVHGHHHETYRTILADDIVVQGVGISEVVNGCGQTVAAAGLRQSHAYARARARPVRVETNAAPYRARDSVEWQIAGTFFGC